MEEHRYGAAGRRGESPEITAQYPSVGGGMCQGIMRGSVSSRWIQTSPKVVVGMLKNSSPLVAALVAPRPIHARGAFES